MLFRSTEAGADAVRECAHLELLMEPELSVLLFRRVGWGQADYDTWSARVLASGLTFAVPTTWKGETCLRLCIVNPETTVDDIRAVLESMR